MTIHSQAHRLREAAVAALQAAPAQTVGARARQETAADPRAPVRILARPAEALVVPRALRAVLVPLAPRAVVEVAVAVAQATGATEGRRRQRTVAARSTRFSAV